jgi:hypothetical protein
MNPTSWQCGTAISTLLSRICCGLLVLALAACAAPRPDTPLVPDVNQRGYSYCQAPIKAAGLAWNSRIGFALDMYFNQSRTRVIVESVRLLDPHNLASHGGLVYEMYRSAHPLVSAAAWDKMGDGAPAPQWAERQAIPGAVIQPGHGLPPGLSPSPRFNIWEVAIDVSVVRPGGGWALGEVVTYRADGSWYTVTAETGIAIGSGHSEISPVAKDGNCAAQINAITEAFKRQPKT